MNEELSALSKKQGYNVKSIVKLVKENEEILDAMKENIRQKVLQGRRSDEISLSIKLFSENGTST